MSELNRVRGDAALAAGARIEGFEALVELVWGKRVVALTGAGCSTGSGIPDYRGPLTRDKPRNPIQYLPFVRKPEVRQRYWARSAVGWPTFSSVDPNPTHDALARWERQGALHGIITQNVDGLHTKAGSENVVELHGALADVYCMECKAHESRDQLQQRIHNLNPTYNVDAQRFAPDGDADVLESKVLGFRVPACLSCGGVLKPQVVFFGENVPGPVITRAWSMFDEAQVLLVVGSSLTVFSGYRFVREAQRRGIPVGVVNLGPTRAQGEVDVQVDSECGVVLSLLVDGLNEASGLARLDTTSFEDTTL